MKNILKNILLVDDDRNLCEVLKLSLSAQGYNVIVSHDGKDALAKVESEKPSLMILDVGIPVLNGIELCKLIKTSEKFKQIPVIMLTAGKTIGDWQNGFDAGADVYMNKPYDWDALAATIQGFLKDPEK